MKPALGVAMAVWVAVLASGCGTVCNLAGGVLHPDAEPRVYGGVQRDLEHGFLCAPIKSVSTPGEAELGLLLLALGPAELGLSFVGDTLTLPLTIPLQEIREAAQKSDEGSR
jgi:uncharacterized protein YceK